MTVRFLLPRSPARPPWALLGLSVGLLLSSGCAVKTTVGIMDADQAVRRAEASAAPQVAVHDVTMARAYLDEAQHQYARSRYQSADELAAEAVRLADEATQKAAVGGDPLQVVPEEVDVASPPEDMGAEPEEPDDSELMQIIEQDKDPGQPDDDRPSIMEDNKLDSDIFDEDAQ